MPTLSDMLAAAGERMRLDLAERLVSHPGELGTAREEVIREFLRRYLPARYHVGTGFAFDSHGKVSQQLDIVITRDAVCPRFEASGGTRFYPCESIVGVGQVKSSISTKVELKQAIENIASAKILDRTASGKATDIVTGKPLDPDSDHLDQIFGFIFVCGKSPSTHAVRDVLVNLVSSASPRLWTNVILALNRYVATFCCDNGVCPNPLHARGVAIQRETGKVDVLMKFYLLLARACDSTRVSSLPYWEYLANLNGWSAEVWHSAISDPPPFLHELSPGS